MRLLTQSQATGRLSKHTQWSRALLAASFATICASDRVSAQIAAWNFFGDSTAVATSAADLFSPNLDSSSNVTRGATAAASAAGNSFRTTGFQNNGIAISNTDYFQTTLSAAAGYALSLSTIDAKFAGTTTYAATPGVSGQFAYSLDGTNFTLIGSPQVTIGTPATLTQVSLTGITALQDISDTQTVTIRYYASGQTATGGWGFNSPSAAAANNGLAFGGTLTPVGGGDTTSPTLTTTGPTTGATGVLTTTNLGLTYNESLVAGSGTITIKKMSDDSTVEIITVPSSQVTINGATATINPATVLDYTTSYYVVATAGTFTDAATNPVAAITSGTLNFTTRSAALIVINQYYEGVSNSRFIELKNLTGSPIVMDNYRLASWSASDSPSNQAWKSGTEITPRVTSLTGLTIPANGYFLICDPAATFPAYAVTNRDLSPAFPSGVAYSGTGSVVLYSSATNDQNSIVDAISITTTEGTDTSFYRLNNLPGFDFTTGTSITNYSTTWGTKTVALVDSALVTDPWYLQASQPPKVLTLNIIPSTFSEGAGAAAATGTVTRSSSTSGDLVVTIISSDTSEAIVAASVTILDGNDNATFPINAVNDLYLDGDVPVTVTVSALNHTPANKLITVTDELTDLPFPVVINEVDSDQAGTTDAGEFVELYNNSGSSVSLDGVSLVFYNGSSNTSYLTVDLTGKTISANGFFVVGNPAVPNVGATFGTGTLQNGEDAVALYLGQAAAYPNGTVVATTAGKLVDAVVYGTNDPAATALIAALTPGKPQVDEGASPSSETVSIARRPNDGGAAFDTTLYVAQAPSPGTTNVLAPPNNYSNWINGFYIGVTDPLIIGFNADPDNDGVPNGIEALYGGNPSAAGVFATTQLTKTGNVFSFLYPQARTIPIGVTAAYEWSADLQSWYTTGQSDGVNTVTLLDIVYDDDNVSPTVTHQLTATVTVGSPAKLFVRVVAKK